MSTKVPPNGGWGWIIVIAYSLSSMATISVLQGFGLIFKESFAILNLTATDTAVIININFAFGMLLGLINGPLLKIFGYRKIAIVGSIVFSTGITLTAFANNFLFIIISYGLLTSIGIGMLMSGFSLAFNSYFTTKRGRAMGLAMTLIGLGPIFSPQIASFLLSYYGIQGTIMLFGAFTLHSLAAALLLQPVKWHMKDEPICLETIPKSEIISNDEEENCNAEDEVNVQSFKPTLNNHQRQRKTTISSIDHDIEVGSIYGYDTPLPRQISVGSRTNLYDINSDTEMSTINRTTQYPWWNSARSVKSINLGSSMKIFDEPIPITKKLTFVDINDKINKSHQSISEDDSLLEKKMDNGSINENGIKSNKNESGICRFLKRVADLYDLDLLRDPIYVNIMLGMSIAIFAEANFSLLTPFILSDMKMTTPEIASVMSVIAAADLISRGTAPFLGEWLHQTSRIMYLFSLCLLIIGRTSLMFVSSFTSVLIVAIGLGIAKGIRSVYMVLVVPSYVPIQKLPSASAIQMVTNGIILTCVGPIIGLIRDNTGSYVPCIILINSVTAFTVTIWLIEIIIVRSKSSWRK